MPSISGKINTLNFFLIIHVNWYCMPRKDLKLTRGYLIIKQFKRFYYESYIFFKKLALLKRKTNHPKSTN